MINIHPSTALTIAIREREGLLHAPIGGFMSSTSDDQVSRSIRHVSLIRGYLNIFESGATGRSGGRFQSVLVNSGVHNVTQSR